jgi:hypothetical protein
MAMIQDVLTTGGNLRDQLFGLSQDGNYSPEERDGFARLRTYYHMKLEAFFLAPCCGDPSASYDAPLDLAAAAIALGGNCQPSDIASQQAYYDAVHSAAVALQTVTDAIPRPLKKVPR